MTEADVFEQTQGAYLSLIHPILAGDRYQEDVAPVLAVAPAVPEALVASMLVGASWRERLLGLCLAMSRGQATWASLSETRTDVSERRGHVPPPPAFVDSILQSLRDPRGIALWNWMEWQQLEGGFYSGRRKR